ncbi:phage portal protein [Stomatohabitans albus]|uniref:phage portal protein n=1 Tax=Stomatohabitans albus TaxID=3110766 RepID=UPI00300CBD6D
MAVIQTGGRLISMRDTSQRATPSYSVAYTDDFGITFADIWRTQPAVRTVVGFIARQIAQLGLHVFDRVSDTERVRITDGSVAEVISAPNPWTTAYGWVDAIIHDLCIYGNSFWAKIPSGGQAAPLWLLRLQPEQVAIEGNSWQVARYVFTPKSGGDPVSLEAAQVLHLKTYNALDPRLGLSPLETLRDVLAADKAAVDWYRAFQKNHGRMAGIIERPADAPKWSDDRRDAFAAQWKAMYSGAENAGATAVLEDGMTFKAITSTPKDALFLDLRKLTTEQVAAAYHVPPSMVGLSDKGTSWASEREHSRMLFRDTLPPWMEQVTQDLERQLLPDLGAGPGVYLEFNLRAKLEGDFTEQAQAFQMQVGAPFMTRNEARARLNLPPVEGGSELITPLNVATGAVASPRDTDPASFLSRDYLGKRRALSSEERAERRQAQWLDQPRNAASGQLGVTHAAIKEELRQRWDSGERTISGLFSAQKWDRRMVEQLRPAVLADLERATKDLAETILGDVEVMQGMEDTMTAHAKAHNADIMRALADVLRADDPEAAFDAFLKGGFKKPHELVDTWFDGYETQAKGLLGRRLSGATKTWVVTSANPRASHAAMHGETVPATETFSNGLMWPRDTSSTPDEWLHCRCELVINRPEESGEG